MVRYFRSHLAWKMFFSYLIVIVIGAIVLITVSEFAMPRAFRNEHSNDGKYES